VELTELNSPRDKVFVWLVGPLLIMKEQIKNLKLTEDEEFCLRKLVMVCKNERTEDWDNTGFPSSDTVRKAQLQAIIRRYVIKHQQKLYLLCISCCEWFSCLDLDHFFIESEAFCKVWGEAFSGLLILF